MEASHARDTVLDAAAEIYDLLLEPLTLIYKHHGVYTGCESLMNISTANTQHSTTIQCVYKPLLVSALPV